ncbi:MAG TPA: MarR family transcriptional regulator [Galbitalea sp.]|jgi:DNA-binding MarR family transcriptional regulator|nr:MarR family transcriptional regulator [Galbitalea sp.]
MTDHSAARDSRDEMSEWPTGRLLSTAARLVENAWHAALEDQGLTHAGLIVLHLLDSRDLSQSELAARARVQAQTMSRTIDRLERAGFVVRESDAADGRRRVVTRTDAGRTVWRRTRGLEAELFPTSGDHEQLRDSLLAIIRASSESRRQRS